MQRARKETKASASYNKDNKPAERSNRSRSRERLSQEEKDQKKKTKRLLKEKLR
jgi:hypothetical protein